MECTVAGFCDDLTVGDPVAEERSILENRDFGFDRAEFLCSF